MTDRAKRAREVAGKLFDYRRESELYKAAICIIEHTLTAEHNATVEACAKIAWDMQRKEGRSEIGNEISALLVE